MADVPENLKYTSSHEWLAKDDNQDQCSFGITAHAQQLLGDVVFIELPAVGTKLKAGDECGVVESVKAASDLYAPISGEVIEVNTKLNSEPTLLNQQPYTEGWIAKIKPDNPADFDKLLDAKSYEEKILSEA